MTADIHPSATLADLGHAEASATPGRFATVAIVCQCGRQDDDRTRIVHERDVALSEIDRLRAENAALREGYAHVGDHDLGNGPQPIYVCPLCEAIRNAGDAHLRKCLRRPATEDDR